MMDTAKLVLYWDCNLKCPYCCNNDLQVYNSFTKMSLHDLAKTKYRDYELTGGEPLLYPEFLFRVLQYIPPDANVYLYTNGLLLTKEMAEQLKDNSLHRIHGINIGFHNVPLDWRVLEYVHNKLIPIRLLIQDIDFTTFLQRLNIPKRIWTLGECYNITTDRFFIVG